MADVTMRQMLEAGVHFGHQTRYWNPKMAPYIFGERNKIHIVNLEKTQPMFVEAMNYLGKLATRVLATGESLWFDGSTEDLPPQVEEALDDYIDESHTKMIAILPLRRPKGADSVRETVTGEADEESNEANEIRGDPPSSTPETMRALARS